MVNYHLINDQGHVQQLTGRLGWTIGTDCQTGQLLDSFHPYPVEQNGRDCRQAIHYIVYRLPAIAAILFYGIMMKVVQQLTCLDRPSQWSGLFDR